MKKQEYLDLNKKFVAAWQFLTIIPITKHKEVSLWEVGEGQGLFPLVGLILGLLLLGLNFALSKVFPWGLTAAFLIVALIVITGGIHLDGFADLCDALKGGASTEERLKILSDVHIGAGGIIGICLIILVKYFSLFNLPEELRTEALIMMPVLGRWAMNLSIFHFPAAKSTGLGKAIKDKASPSNLALATAISLIIALVLMRLKGMMLFGGTWLITWLWGKFFCLKFGGFTGDIYGAINEITEVMALVLIILLGRL